MHLPNRYPQRMSRCSYHALPSFQPLSAYASFFIPYPAIPIFQSIIMLTRSQPNATTEIHPRIIRPKSTHPSQNRFPAPRARRENARRLWSIHQTDSPPQSGITRPGFRFLAESMRPHLSSHSLPGLLNLTFHGSSKAENLSHSPFYQQASP